MSRRLFHQLFSRGLASDREGREIGAASLAYPIQVAAFDFVQDAVREASATLRARNRTRRQRTKRPRQTERGPGLRQSPTGLFAAMPRGDPTLLVGRQVVTRASTLSNPQIFIRISLSIDPCRPLAGTTWHCAGTRQFPLTT